MILQLFFLILTLFTSNSNLRADAASSNDEHVQPSTQNLDTIQEEIVQLTNQQKLLKEQKNILQEELKKATDKLDQTQKQQSTLTSDIHTLTASATRLTHENQQLAEHNAHKNKIIQELEEEKAQLQNTVSTLQDHLEAMQSQEKNIVRSKLEAETKATLEIHRLQRTIMKLQEKIDNSSLSDAVNKHLGKLAVAFVLGGATTYAITTWS